MSDKFSFHTIHHAALAQVTGGIVSFQVECADSAFMAGLRASLAGRDLSASEKELAALQACQDGSIDTLRRMQAGEALSLRPDRPNRS